MTPAAEVRRFTPALATQVRGARRRLLAVFPAHGNEEHEVGLALRRPEGEHQRVGVVVDELDTRAG
ncbi:MAG: hypothetical protein GQE15_28555 [Archangiaceae bacterium]|nr:hypothetical protein [Archangiaceae bacterium]